MRTLELFAGIGACSKALERIGINVEIVDAVEIDKYAIKSFNAIHGTDFKVQDIKEWDKDLKDIDLITHGSPCQDFSIAGKQEGGDLGSGTRSSLMYETIRIVGKIRPKYVLWENVKNILSKKHKHNFDAYIDTMNVLGYNSYYKVLDAKDYGVPQHRERVYTVSIRKDIDTGFVFPEPMELKLRLKDILEDEVDEKYYLSEKMINFFYKNEQIQKEKGNGFRFGVSDGNVVAKSVTTRAGSRMDDNFIEITDAEVSRIGGIFDTEKSKHQAGSVYDKEGLCPTLDAMQGGWRQPSIITVGNYMPSNHDASRIVDSNGLAPTVKENHGTITATITKPKLINNDKRLKQLVENTEFQEGKVLNLDTYNQTTNENISQCLTEPHHNTQRLFDGYRIRKLTPKECWRLMGFDDEDFEKAAGVPTSNTQLYKQAGNSIVVNVLEKIFRNLFEV
ncbi:MAG: DNA cytosine methyltransferase [Bacteroidales bacterium]|nr:DNA cytosine methyltransferase [Bacteroidales bacterium]